VELDRPAPGKVITTPDTFTHLPAAAGSARSTPQDGDHAI
jgi:hypothetical protein